MGEWEQQPFAATTTGAAAERAGKPSAVTSAKAGWRCSTPSYGQYGSLSKDCKKRRNTARPGGAENSDLWRFPGSSSTSGAPRNRAWTTGDTMDQQRSAGTMRSWHRNRDSLDPWALGHPWE